MAGDIVIVGQVEDQDPIMPAQQSTVTYYNDLNPTWTRAIRAANAAISVVRNGVSSVAWATEILVRGAFLLEQSQTWVTYFDDEPVDATTGYYGVLRANETPTLPTDGDTVTINSIVYTFKDSIGTTAGYVKIDATGATTAEKVANTLANLAACIGGTTGAGTLYVATEVSPNASVSVLSLTKTVLTVRAKATVVNVGTTVVSTGAAVAWDAATLSTPYAVSFVGKVATELTPVSFAWYESSDGETNWTALATGGIYSIVGDGSGLQSVLTITPTNLDKTGYSYKCVASDSATGTLTSTGTQPADGDTVVIAGITYTFKTVLGATAGNVLIGATVTDTMSNLAACINGGTGAGSLYVATAVSPSVSVTAAAFVETVTVTVRAGVTGVTLAAASAGTEQMEWDLATIPNTITSEIVELTVL